MIGLDTSAIIDLAKSNPEIKNLLQKNREPLATCIMNYSEIMFGIDFKKSKRKEESEDYEKFFNSIFFINMTRQSSKMASKIFWKLQREGKIIGKFDCLIAGCFLENGITKIITRNVKHFERIEGLEVINY